MSNNQWNNGQGERQWQPEGNPDWNAPTQPAPRGGDWNAPQEQAAEWNSGAQAQGSAQEWNPAASQQDWNAQQGNQDWNQPAQEWNQPAQDWNAPPQQPGGQDWTAQQPQGTEWNAAQHQGSAQDWQAGAPQPGQDWNAQPGAQGWTNQPTQQGGFGGPSVFGGQSAAPGRQRPARSAASTGFGNVFDFSFKKFALPSAAGTIFLASVICFAIWWLFDLIALLTVNNEFYDPTVSTTLSVIFGGLARTLLGVLLTRVLIEGASAVVKLANRADKDDAPAV